MTRRSGAAIVTRRYWWPIVVPFVGYPVLWLLGLSAIAWPLAAMMAVVTWIIEPDIRLRMPGVFALWLAFLAWVVLSVLTIGEPDRLMSYGYRFVMYASATVLFAYVYSMPRDALPDRVVIKSLAGFWVSVAIGGLIGVVAPTLSFTTPVEMLLPASLLNNGLIANLVNAQFAAESRILGYTVGRPEALFPFTNAWGSNFAITLPLLFAAGAVSRRWRRWSVPLVAISTVPVILSLNRGMWLTILIGLVYAAVRLLGAGRPGAVAGLVAIALVIVGVVYALDLGSVLEDRAATGHSDDGRLSLYTQSLGAAAESPIIGHGAPLPNQVDPTAPSVGTHGQFWLVLVSQGIPGAILFVAFLGGGVLLTRRWRSDEGVWLNTCLVVVASQLLIYEQLASQMQIVMVVMALSLRAQIRRPDDAQPPVTIRSTRPREAALT